MKTVDELVSGWTDEERAQFNDLIEECRKREKELVLNSKLCEANLARLSQSLGNLYHNFADLKERVGNATDDLLGLYLRMVRTKLPAS